MYYKVSRTIMVFVLRGFLVLASWAWRWGSPVRAVPGAGGQPGHYHPRVHLATSVPPPSDVESDQPGRNLFHVVLLVIGILITVGATSINLYMAIKVVPLPRSVASLRTFCVRAFIDNPDHCYTTMKQLTVLL